MFQNKIILSLKKSILKYSKKSTCINRQKQYRLLKGILWSCLIYVLLLVLMYTKLNINKLYNEKLIVKCSFQDKTNYTIILTIYKYI